MDWERAQNDFNFNDYKHVTTIEVESTDERSALNKAFEIGNTDPNRNYRSISVSDILVIGDIYYYVDSVGFEDITSEVNNSVKINKGDDK